MERWEGCKQSNMEVRRVSVQLVVLLTCLCASWCKKFEGDEKPAWAKKDIRDYTDADLERLLDQWDVS